MSHAQELVDALTVLLNLAKDKNLHAFVSIQQYQPGNTEQSGVLTAAHKPPCNVAIEDCVCQKATLDGLANIICARRPNVRPAVLLQAATLWTKNPNVRDSSILESIVATLIVWYNLNHTCTSIELDEEGRPKLVKSNGAPADLNFTVNYRNEEGPGRSL